jgi:sporulation protein YlmC with PRC-barrel domain
MSPLAGADEKETTMIKRMMAGAAMGALMVSAAALAQQSPGTEPKSTPPAAMEKLSTAGKTAIVTSQKPDQWLASKFKGTEVLGSDNKKIGDVSDILFDKNGKIEAYIVSIGGFLGMGAKDVALPPSAFEVTKGQNGGADKLKSAMNMNELKQAENFKPYEPPRAVTTGAGSTPGGMKPSTNTAPSSR